MSVSFSYRPPPVNAALLLHEVTNVAEDTMAGALLDASQPLVPVEEAVMKKSGRIGRDELGAYVTYGSDDDGTKTHAPSNQYVVKQHEDGDLHHPHGGEFKFLEKPMHAAHEALLAAAAVELKAAFQ